MPSSDYTLLAAYSRVEPFGKRRDDWHHAKTQALIANSFNTYLRTQGATRQTKRYQPQDFTYPRKKTETQKARALTAWLKSMSHRDR